jgi:hypothetical protein
VILDTQAPLPRPVKSGGSVYSLLVNRNLTILLLLALFPSGTGHSLGQAVSHFADIGPSVSPSDKSLHVRLIAMISISPQPGYSSGRYAGLFSNILLLYTFQALEILTFDDSSKSPQRFPHYQCLQTLIDAEFSVQRDHFLQFMLPWIPQLLALRLRHSSHQPVVPQNDETMRRDPCVSWWPLASVNNLRRLIHHVP